MDNTLFKFLPEFDSHIYFSHLPAFKCLQFLIAYLIRILPVILIVMAKPKVRFGAAKE